MSFDWREYLELAKQLSGLQSSGYSHEARDRSVVSRAYYAAFCWVRNYAELRLGFRRTGGGADHRLLRDYLKQRRMAVIASHLNKLRNWRNSCDYEDQMSGLRNMVSESIKLADKVIQQCR
jgi:uncharacterized protein (UPF0332 family)